MDNSTKLKPCPFCGGEATLVETRTSEGYSSYKVAFVKCQLCGCNTGHYITDGYLGIERTAQDAVDAWNKRRDGSYISCDHLNKHLLWVGQDVYDLIRKNPDGVVLEAVCEEPILVSCKPLRENDHNPLAHPERYLDDTMAIVDDMTMAQRKELLKYLEDSIERNKKPNFTNHTGDDYEN